MKKSLLWIAAALVCTSCNAKPADNAPAETPNTDAPSAVDTVEKNDIPEEKVLDNGGAPAKDPTEARIDAQIQAADRAMQNGSYAQALQILYDAEIEFGAQPKLETAYQNALKSSPNLHAEPKQFVPGQDISAMKRIGGGSSLVYKFIKDGQTVAAFKPFQKRFQSNYRSEIAAYRLCPLMKCGFNIPTNLPIYFDFNEFSSLYSRNAANLKEEFSEIIPTKLPDGSHRVDGVYKDWVPDFAEYPIEFSDIWKKWLNPGTTKEDLHVPASTLLSEFAKRHQRKEKFVQKLAPHFNDPQTGQALQIYDLARQLSNLLVFDYLINNWDRFSGAPALYGVNCQFSHGKFMSIDNGAGFSQTPHAKPEKHLHEITRFSRLTYESIKGFDKDEVANILFPNPSVHEMDKIETFWKLREKYLQYVDACIAKNGEAETFFFE